LEHHATDLARRSAVAGQPPLRLGLAACLFFGVVEARLAFRLASSWDALFTVT
jgi:hypothetical protein